MRLASSLWAASGQRAAAVAHHLRGSAPKRCHQTPLMRKLWDSYVHHTRSSNQAVRAKQRSENGRRGNWKRWHRDQAITALMPMVERIARDLRWMFAKKIDVRDLIQAGNLGLVKAADSYDPARGEFEPYAYFRVRGAIIDSQKRRTYREEAHLSVEAIAESNGGSVPARLDTDRGALPEQLSVQRQRRERLSAALESLPDAHRVIFRAHLAGQSVVVIAGQIGESVSWTRTRLAEAKARAAVIVRGEVSARVATEAARDWRRQLAAAVVARASARREAAA